jgi:RNA polymerase sigma-32 factor
VVDSLKALDLKWPIREAEISALENGDLSPEHTAMIAKKLHVQENDVVEMSRRLGGDASLSTLANADEAGEVQDWLVDPACDPEAVFAEWEEAGQRRQALASASTRASDIYLKRGSSRNLRSGLRTSP